MFNEKLLISQEVAVYSCVLWKSQWRIRNWSKIGYSWIKSHAQERAKDPQPPFQHTLWLRFSYPSGLFLFHAPACIYCYEIWRSDFWFVAQCSFFFFFFSWTNWAVSQTLQYYRINLFWIAAIGHKKLDTTGNVLPGNKPSSLEKARVILIWVQSSYQTSSPLWIQWSA